MYHIKIQASSIIFCDFYVIDLYILQRYSIIILVIGVYAKSDHHMWCFLKKVRLI